MQQQACLFNYWGIVIDDNWNYAKLIAINVENTCQIDGITSFCQVCHIGDVFCIEKLHKSLFYILLIVTVEMIVGVICFQIYMHFGRQQVYIPILLFSHIFL